MPDGSGYSVIEPAAASAISWDDGEWVERELPPRPWIATGYLLRGAVTLVPGPPSALKSSTMLGWSVALALGVSFGRFRPWNPAKSIVYNVEDDQTEQRRRLSAVLRSFGAAPADIAGRVIRCTPSALGTLFARDEDGELAPTAAMEALEALIVAEQPAVLIVDPFSELHAEEENDNTAIRTVIARFRALAVKYKIAIVVLHHTRKGSAYTPGDPDTARGASSIIGAVRVALTLTGMSEDDAKAFGMPTDFEARSHYVRMDDAKSNYAPVRQAEWFEKVAYQLDNGDTVAAGVPWTPPQAKVASQMDLMALVKAIEQGSPSGEPWSPKLSKEPRSIRSLLDSQGFTGNVAQAAAIMRLKKECGMLEASYRRPTNGVAAKGLRMGEKPSANWVDED